MAEDQDSSNDKESENDKNKEGENKPQRSSDRELRASDAARELGKLGASKGGKARAEKLTPKERSEIARKAVETRWAKSPPSQGSSKIVRATHGDEDHPLRIATQEIPCYVLEDGRRVLVQHALIKSLGMSPGGTGGKGGDRLAKFVGGKKLNPFLSKDLYDRTANPIKFKVTSGSLAYGYEATILAEICEAVLAARKAGALQKQQNHIADQCELLVRGFARVGIIALVDEATGYQYDRSRLALAEILEKFIAKELVDWARKFPEDFYGHLFRLKGWKQEAGSQKRPMIFARMTVDLIYERLAPGVLAELRKKSPKDQKGRRPNALHQWLSEDFGHPKLKEHFIRLDMLAKVAKTYDKFYEMVELTLPRYGMTMSLPFPIDEDESEDLS